jgi:MFS transporter, SP family, arabinose:H+ symporter
VRAVSVVDRHRHPDFLLHQRPAAGCRGGQLALDVSHRRHTVGNLFALLLRTPETPRYLFLAGRHAEAFAFLQRLAGREAAEFEISEIRASLSEVRPAGWGELMRSGVRRAIGVRFCLAILVHVSGINTIIDYAPAIFRSAGWKIDTALFSTFILGLTNFGFTLVSFWAIDRYGRKPLYITGSLGMCAALTLLLVTVLAEHFEGAIVLALILGYIPFFAFSLRASGRSSGRWWPKFFPTASAALPWLCRY